MTDNPFLPAATEDGLERDPAKAQLFDMVREAVRCAVAVATNPWDQRAAGELAGVKRCVALTLVHAYGAYAEQAHDQVCYALEVSVGEHTLGSGWHEDHEAVVRRAVTTLLRR